MREEERRGEKRIGNKGIKMNQSLMSKCKEKIFAA